MSFHEIIHVLQIQMVSLSENTRPWTCRTVFILILMPPLLRQRFQLPSRSLEESVLSGSVVRHLRTSPEWTVVQAAPDAVKPDGSSERTI